MAQDDLGNSRIDFVWGNFPMQPNRNDNNSARWGMSPYPGDGEADWYLNPDAQATRTENGLVGISNQLQALDSHVIAMRHWANYPNFSEDTGNTLTVDWWDVVPAYQYPNIIGLSLDDAVKQLKECGVAPELLVDAQFDAENPYDGFGGPILNAPGADNPGVIFWQYLSPETQIGSHWDGSPWYASESNGKVINSATYPSEWIPVGEYAPDFFSYWHSFVVLQTEDPNKNSYEWWND